VVASLQKTQSSPLFDDFGVTNLDGQFNCFVSVVLQALWHSPVFRTALAKFTESSYNPRFKEHRFIASLQVRYTLTVYYFSVRSSSRRRRMRRGRRGT